MTCPRCGSKEVGAALLQPPLQPYRAGPVEMTKVWFECHCARCRNWWTGQK